MQEQPGRVSQGCRETPARCIFILRLGGHAEAVRGGQQSPTRSYISVSQLDSTEIKNHRRSSRLSGSRSRQLTVTHIVQSCPFCPIFARFRSHTGSSTEMCTTSDILLENLAATTKTCVCTRSASALVCGGLALLRGVQCCRQLYVVHHPTRSNRTRGGGSWQHGAHLAKP